MTPKVARFLRDSAPATPCLVLDVDRVEENYRRLKAAMPLARIYYAVKANPAAPVLQRLVGLDSCFDAASLEEVTACLEAGARPAAISYGNTVHSFTDVDAKTPGRAEYNPVVAARAYRMMDDFFAEAFKVSGK